jgi:hypothetical protein
VEGSQLQVKFCKYINIPRKQKEDEDMKKYAPAHIESRESKSLRILSLSVSRTNISPLLSVTISKPILFRMMASVVVLRVCVYDRRSPQCPLRIDNLIRPTFFGVSTVMDVLVVMPSRRI